MSLFGGIRQALDTLEVAVAQAERQRDDWSGYAIRLAEALEIASGRTLWRLRWRRPGADEWRGTQVYGHGKEGDVARRWEQLRARGYEVEVCTCTASPWGRVDLDQVDAWWP